jgi:hypothetical protein
LGDPRVPRRIILKSLSLSSSLLSAIMELGNLLNRCNLSQANNKTDLKKSGIGAWVELFLAQDRNRMRTLVNAVMNLRSPKKMS